MAALIVAMHETVKGYINSAENRNLATEIGSDVLELTRAVVKKTHSGEKQGVQVPFSAASENVVSNSITVEQSYCEKNAPKTMYLSTLDDSAYLELS